MRTFCHCTRHENPYNLAAGSELRGFRLGLGVWGLGFGAQRLGFRVPDPYITYAINVGNHVIVPRAPWRMRAREAFPRLPGPELRLRWV